MAYQYTSYDLEDNLTELAGAIARMTDTQGKKAIRGTACKKELRNIELLNVLFEILSCYEPYAVGGISTNCLTEEEMDDLFEVAAQIANLKFDVKGKIS